MIFGSTPSRAVTTLVMWLLSVCAVASESSRANHGNTPYPIWSELSYFERTALSNAPRAHGGDPDALLALYLVASGVGDLDSYHSVKRKVDAFVANNSSYILEPESQWLTGKRLNSAMHSAFFSDGGAFHSFPPGYAVEQSRLMGIFENGEFNCISSSLLYAVLARRLGLTPLGVFLPSHAFIQLNLPEGRQVDVETTSPHGFDLPHNAAFYEKMQDNRFAGTTLQPATYADYLERERVDLVTLAARNMLNQHTSAERMSEGNRNRLAEISAYLDPGYDLAQQKRLYFYNSEVRALADDAQWNALERMFAVTAPHVLADAKRHSEHSAIQKALQHYLAAAVLTHAHLIDPDQTLHYAGLVMDQPETDTHAMQQTVYALGVLLAKLAEQQRFDDGALIITLMDAHLQESSGWPDSVHGFYMRWSDALLNDRHWQTAVEVLNEYLERRDATEGVAHTQTRLASAYKDWVLDRLLNKDSEGAGYAMSHCQSRHSNAAVCKGATESMRQSASVK